MDASPYWLAPDQPWARDHLAASHQEALYRFGEYAMFVLLWTAEDFDLGRVDHCQRCYETRHREAAVFGQAGQNRCPNCFGTSFEGGFRARIIRPSLWGDSAPDTTKTPRGQVKSDSMAVETTGDFTVHHGDFVVRAGDRRYRALEIAGSWVRSGFADPTLDTAFSGTIPQVRLEDRKASVAYDVPPAAAGLDPVLRRPVTQHLVIDIATYDLVRGPLRV